MPHPSILPEPSRDSPIEELSRHNDVSRQVQRANNTCTRHQQQFMPEISIPLVSLPLRPSTLTALLRSGFATTGDVLQSLCSTMCTENEENPNSNQNIEGNHAHFAMEVGCSPAQAADYAIEINDALESVGLSALQTTKQNHNDESTSASAASSLFPATAASLLSSKRNNRHTSATRQIVSFCKPLDTLLGGGAALAELTEIVGPPGSGKTQLAFQLCVDARLPAAFGGVEGRAVVIDSEGSWGANGMERCWDMACALVDHVRNSALRKLEAKKVRERIMGGVVTQEDLVSLGLDTFTPETIMEGIHIFRVHDEASQTCTLYNLPKFLMEQEEKKMPVKLVVIDSMAFHYRMSGSSLQGKYNGGKSAQFSTSTYNVTRIATLLTEIASEFDVAVVALNHLTTKIDYGNNGIGGGLGGVTKLVPALGESWAHSVTSRVMLDHRSRLYSESSTANGGAEDVRICTLVKSPHKPPGTAEFVITDKGIRGVPSQNALQSHKRAATD